MPDLVSFFCVCLWGSAVLPAALPPTAMGRLAPSAVADLQADVPDLEVMPQDDLADSSADFCDDVDRWVLHDVLHDRGIAASQDWHQAVQSLGLAPKLCDAGPWQDDVMRARLVGLLRGLPEQHHQIDTSKLAFDIPLATHPLVDLYIDYFTGRGRLMFTRWLTRAARYAPLMQEILARQHVPQDLVYVAMIESGFSAHAYSSAAAAGYWQFMQATGQLYGLQQDHWVDERRDFIKATEAAATYMQQLYKTLGDWHLAWASYNAGEGRIRRALTKYGERDFWALIAHRDSVAKETMHYVPKVIAAALVAKDAKRYGFNIPAQPPLAFDEVAVQGAVDLQILAEGAHIAQASLHELNPALLHGITPPGQTTRLRVPQGKRNVVRAALQRVPVNQRLVYLTHRVHPGETLSGIAQQFGTDVTTLKAFNRLLGSRVRAGQQVIVPTRGTTTHTLARSTPSRATTLHPKFRTVVATRAQANRPRHLRRGSRRHVVGSGETLWGIARHYQVGINQIKGHRRANHLAVGDVLEIL